VVPESPRRMQYVQQRVVSPFNVTGTTSFNFVRRRWDRPMLTPAITAWPGATINTDRAGPGVDGRAFVAYKVTGPVAERGIMSTHSLITKICDRSIQSFSVPLGCAPVSRPRFHAPPNHPGIANDGTQGSGGYSNAPWNFESERKLDATWSSETLPQTRTPTRFGVARCIISVSIPRVPASSAGHGQLLQDRSTDDRSRSKRPLLMYVGQRQPRTADPESDARTTDADRGPANGDTNTCADFNARPTITPGPCGDPLLTRTLTAWSRPALARRLDFATGMRRLATSNERPRFAR
jgi:hypothetical protein